MRDSWDSYERAAERGPLSLFFKVMIPVAIMGAALGTCGYAFNWCSKTAEVVQDEVGPRALLDKYMWLKDAHAQLEKKQADIKVYQVGLNNISAQYYKIPRNKWAREDRDAYNIRSTEVAGVIASYNDLAAQYNAKMSEVNWKFTNVGDLPRGASEPLPREYAPYRTE